MLAVNCAWFLMKFGPLLFSRAFQSSHQDRAISDGFGVRASLFREVAEGPSETLRIGAFRLTKVVILIDKLRGSSWLLG